MHSSAAGVAAPKFSRRQPAWAAGREAAGSTERSGPAEAGRRAAEPWWLSRRYWYLRLLIAAGTIALALLVDRQVFLLVSCIEWPGIWFDLFDAARLFGEPLGIAIVLTTIGIMDRARRRSIPIIIAMTVAASLTATGLKMLISRQRPGRVLGRTVVLGPEVAGVNSSFPSGHATSAFALACGLCLIYSRGRAWFLWWAFACAVSRVSDGMHFVSDVVAGAWLGWEMALWLWLPLARFASGPPGAAQR